MTGIPEEVQAAIEEGADLEARDMSGKTVYDYAKNNYILSDSDVLELLKP